MGGGCCAFMSGTIAAMLATRNARAVFGPQEHALLARFLPVVCVLTFALCACQNRKVKVEITATGDGATRTFATNDTARSSLDAATRAYGSEGSADPELGRKFTGKFAESALPSEIGNHGAIGRLESSLGSARLYYEQFADRRSEWQAMRDRVESGVLWLKIFGRFIEVQKLKKEPARTAFSSWWNGEVVPLVADAYLMYSGMQGAIQSQRIGVMPRKSSDFTPRTADEEFSARVLEPLVILFAERGWITPDELAAGQMAAADGNITKREREWMLKTVAAPLIQRIAAKFDPNGQGVSVESLPMLGLEFLAWKSFSRQYRDLLLESPAISESTKADIRKGKWDFELPPPFGIRMLEKPKVTDAEVIVDTGAEPFFTNGRWNGASERLEVKGGFYEGKYRYTSYNPPYYAVWALPSQRQESVFGRVILEGEPLGQYCAWESSLEEDVKAKWLLALEDIARAKDITAATVILAELGASAPPPRALTEWFAQQTAKTATNAALTQPQ